MWMVGLMLLDDVVGADIVGAFVFVGSHSSVALYMASWVSGSWCIWLLNGGMYIPRLLRVVRKSFIK